MESLDRRYCERFEVPGAQVLYKLNQGVCARTQLKNITKSSVRFEIKHDAKPGDFVELEIQIPRKERICAKGNIVWISNSKPPYYSVVQFLAFSTDKRYNSLECLEQLKRVEAEYFLANEEYAPTR